MFLSLEGLIVGFAVVAVTFVAGFAFSVVQSGKQGSSTRLPLETKGSCCLQPRQGQRRDDCRHRFVSLA
jgi:hypothetical protein